MQAYLCRRYGGPEVLELAELPTPVPGANEVLVRIHATTVSSGDTRVRALRMPAGFGPVARLAVGMTGPRQPILGTELAGIVESVGARVTRFKAGDAVFAFPGSKMGSHAEYRAIAEDGPIALKPANLSLEEAVALSFGGSTALHFLERAHLQRGESVLVIGASGTVGAALVQLAALSGADVTAVTSTANLDLVASLGARRTIDYTRQDFTTQQKQYDVIADAVGATSYARCKHVLAPGGRLLAIAGGMSDFLSAVWAPMTGSRKVIAGPADEPPARIQHLAELAETRAFRPVIDRQFGFAQMAEAHAYVDTGRKRGSVVVTMSETVRKSSDGALTGARVGGLS
jgi:NADPH:quinone reductase-like Zn-dependent oxidoreductase